MKREDYAIILNKKDNVAIAKRDYNEVKSGDRFALEDVPENQYLYQYGYPFAKSLGIKQDELISLKNTTNDIPKFNRNDFVEPQLTNLVKKYQDKTFLGYKRKDGKVGTRNYIAIIPTSMCASEVSNQIAKVFDVPEFIDKYPNVDGVVSLAHTEGCGCGAGNQIERTMQILKGFALHPNVFAAVFIDLGCEQTSYDVMSQYINQHIKTSTSRINWLTIQKNGGTAKTINKAVSIVEDFLKEANSCMREDASISNLVLGTECGASDRFSGITANPLIGDLADKIIYANGKAILSEIPEMLGVYDMFFKRFASAEVADKFQAAIDWYLDIAKKLDVDISNNLVPANVQGGLINSYIKSLGAVMKGGSTRIEDVINYGESANKRGLSIMQGPGNDLESITGLISSGANMIGFSTGYGTITGSAIVPVIKISSNTKTFNDLDEDIDFNAGRLLNDEYLDVLSDELLEKTIKIASGKEQSWPEKWKQRQFQIWTAGKLTL
ncbi:MAG: hypothetical protein HN336_10290 [Lentimicrobiaceae bacterium]|jgi:altronate dehydratase|nr:hypothetical protein [Lentimicrobiaceae bacterium]